MKWVQHALINLYRGAWLVFPGNRKLAHRIEELSEVVSRDAHAYVDHALSSRNSQGIVTQEVLEHRSMVGVQEAKAYADGAVGRISSSLGGLANALVELSERVDEIQSANDKPLHELPLGLETELTALTAKLDDLATRQPNQDSCDIDPQAILSAKATLTQLNHHVDEIKGALARMDEKVTQLAAAQSDEATGKDRTASS